MDYLVIDIETAPMESFHWSKRTDFIASCFNEQETTILCAAWRLPNGKIETTSIADFHKRLTYKSVRNDKGVTKKLGELLTWCADENIIVVYQNGNRFDLPKIVGRTIVHRLPAIPKKHLVTVDTLLKARGLGLDYANLDYRDKLLNGQGKVETRGWAMWHDIVGRDSNHKTRAKALKEMLHYNKGDILSSDRDFRRLLPYMDGLPNMNLWLETDNNCPACGSENVIYRTKPQLTATRAYRRKSCNDCNRWFRETKSIKEYTVAVRAA